MGILFLVLCLTFADTTPANIEVIGVLRTPVYKIGGQTTGYVLEGTRYQLEFLDTKIKEKAWKMNAKKVHVTGKVRTEKDVESNEDIKIITVKTIEEKK